VLRVWTLVRPALLMAAVPLKLIGRFCFGAYFADVLGASVLGGLLGSAVANRYLSRRRRCLC
jgi:hypothetical protein